MLNRIVLIGRLTQDPELRYTKNGIAVASFTLAVDRRYKNAEGERETDFIDVVVWRQQAENCANYLSKGKLCAVDGSLQLRSYEAKDGTEEKLLKLLPMMFGSFPPKIVAATGRLLPLKAAHFAAGNDADMVGDDDLPF